jgi:hypothetical protein
MMTTVTAPNALARSRRACRRPRPVQTLDIAFHLPQDRTRRARCSPSALVVVRIVDRARALPAELEQAPGSGACASLIVGSRLTDRHTRYLPLSRRPPDVVLTHPGQHPGPVAPTLAGGRRRRMGMSAKRLSKGAREGRAQSMSSSARRRHSKHGSDFGPHHPLSVRSIMIMVREIL